MRTILSLTTALSLASLTALSTLSGCDEKKPSAKPAPSTAGTTTTDDHHGHDHGPDGEHKDKPATDGPGHGGAVIALGRQSIGSFEATATRDEGPIVAGKDAPIDVTVIPAAGAASKPAAVRFWIGTQDAKGSVKAKAEVESPSGPDRWHVHVEIPSPMPEGCKLWVEIEDDQGARSLGSFDLMR